MIGRKVKSDLGNPIWGDTLVHSVMQWQVQIVLTLAGTLTDQDKTRACLSLGWVQSSHVHQWPEGFNDSQHLCARLTLAETAATKGRKTAESARQKRIEACQLAKKGLAQADWGRMASSLPGQDFGGETCSYCCSSLGLLAPREYPAELNHLFALKPIQIFGSGEKDYFNK